MVFNNHRLTIETLDERCLMVGDPIESMMEMYTGPQPEPPPAQVGSDLSEPLPSYDSTVDSCQAEPEQDDTSLANYSQPGDGIGSGPMADSGANAETTAEEMEPQDNEAEAELTFGEIEWDGNSYLWEITGTLHYNGQPLGEKEIKVAGLTEETVTTGHDGAFSVIVNRPEKFGKHIDLSVSHNGKTASRSLPVLPIY